jgi:hypothetical protein
LIIQDDAHPHHNYVGRHSPLARLYYLVLQLWVLAAKLEVRAKRLDAARRILGMAIGMAPKVGSATLVKHMHGLPCAVLIYSALASQH